jgi:hypothetical protein
MESEKAELSHAKQWKTGGVFSTWQSDSAFRDKGMKLHEKVCDPVQAHSRSFWPDEMAKRVPLNVLHIHLR